MDLPRHALGLARKLIFLVGSADMPRTILQIAHDGDIVLTMGAGSIGQVPGKLARSDA